VEKQRRYKRVVFREPYQLTTRKGELLGSSLSFDLSIGGIRLRAEDFLPLGSEVSIRFSCKEDRLLTMNGKVSWVQKVPHSDAYQIGVEFDEAQENLYWKTLIRDFVKEQGQKV